MTVTVYSHSSTLTIYIPICDQVERITMEEQQRTQRIALQSVRTIRTSGVPANANFDNYYFPINVNQIRELEESIHTRLEMLNLSKKSEDAAKVVFNELLWQWFYEAQENSTTSFEGCIAPVICDNNKDSKLYPSNRWGYESEEQYKTKVPKTDPTVLQN